MTSATALKFTVAPWSLELAKSEVFEYGISEKGSLPTKNDSRDKIVRVPHWEQKHSPVNQIKE